MKLDNTRKNGTEVAQPPTEGKTGKNENQELIRKKIQEALDELNEQLEKHVSELYTLIQEQIRKGYKTVPELKADANKLFEQWFERTQRNFNGKSWEAIIEQIIQETIAELNEQLKEDASDVAEPPDSITSEECHESDVKETPTAGRPFEVNPLGIDRSKFEKPRTDGEQEKTRQRILKAFIEVDKNPGKYAAKFYTLFPKEKKEGYITITELKKHAKELGGPMVDRIEQDLELAQRIDNGETWEKVCNDPDTAEWHRGIIWNIENGYVRIVGGAQMGSQKTRDFRSATWYNQIDLEPSYHINWTVPLVRLDFE